jgi:hypothetical protein
MKQRKKDEIDTALAMIEKIFKSGAMEHQVYHKCLVSLAYEYILADAGQEGLIQLSRVPASYFKDYQLAQMKEDGMYSDLVVLLSYRLIQMGVVDGSDEVVVPTMAMARA